MIKRIAVPVVFFMCIFLLAGCNTIKGIGKDIEKGGEAIQRSSGK